MRPRVLLRHRQLPFGSRSSSASLRSSPILASTAGPITDPSLRLRRSEIGSCRVGLPIHHPRPAPPPTASSPLAAAPGRSSSNGRSPKTSSAAPVAAGGDIASPRSPIRSSPGGSSPTSAHDRSHSPSPRRARRLRPSCASGDGSTASVARRLSTTQSATLRRPPRVGCRLQVVGISPAPELNLVSPASDPALG